jgi:hypothetical protein
VSAETQQSSKLCGTVLATVPEIGKKDTIVKLLIVEVSMFVLLDRKWNDGDCLWVTKNYKNNT